MGEQTLVEVAQSMTGGIGPSIAIDTTGHPLLMNQAFALTAHRGKVIFIANPSPPEPMQLDLIPFIAVGPPTPEGWIDPARTSGY